LFVLQVKAKSEKVGEYMQCDGTWEPSRLGLYCSLCDIERRWEEGPPFHHGKPRMLFQKHGLTNATKQRVFAALFERQQGKCFICGISQAELEVKTHDYAVALAEETAQFLEQRETWSEIFTQWAEGRAEYDPALSFEERVALLYQRNTVQRTLNIDHCHTTGMIRGLLCASCNFTLGNVENWVILNGNIRPELSEHDFENEREWLAQHKDILHQYMQQERWLPLKDILFHLQHTG
jgi:Recombination endonuclease VII